ncbi:MAG: hypothetical protein I8H81_04865 [Pseudomonadales bacterium]|nr:hypothetical protein [Pseudomonadales bacterium]MBH2031455.1 hypothetical protein [Pseudomonadales bacterium]MBH2074801.1 hypothetical protein [Pseudomonadales bacterium]
MSSERILDPQFDLLLPPDNAASLVINHQPPRVNSIFSVDRQQLINIDGLSRAESLYGLPVVDATTPDSSPKESAIAQGKATNRDHPKHDRANLNNW